MSKYLTPALLGPTRSERIAENRQAMQAAEERYLSFAMGTPGRYTTIKSLSPDDRKVDVRTIIVAEFEGNMTIASSKNEDLRIPFDWLFRDAACPLPTDSFGQTLNDMHAFLRQVMESEIDYVSAFQDFLAGRAKNRKIPPNPENKEVRQIAKAPTLVLVTKNGLHAEQPAKPAPEIKPAAHEAASNNGKLVESAPEAAHEEMANDKPAEREPKPSEDALPFSDFKLGASHDHFYIDDGEGRLEFSQGRNDKKMRIKVEYIDPEHPLVAYGITAGLKIAVGLVDVPGAEGALRGQNHQGIEEKCALAKFIREKLATRPAKEMRKVA